MDSSTIETEGMAVAALIPVNLTLEKVFYAVLTLVVCALAIKVLMRFAKKYINKLPIEKTLSRFVTSVANAVLIFVAALIVADQLGIPISTLVTLFGVIGLAFSLAIQDSLSNIFSGFTLLISKPFKAGDYIEIGDAGGTVDHIGLMYTRLLTPDNKVISIPNKETASEKLINFSAQASRRIEVKVGVSYDAPTAAVKKALAEAIGKVKYFDEPAPFVGLHAFKDSSIEYVLRIFVSPKDYWDIYYRLMEEIRAALERHDIKIPYNQLDVRLAKPEE